VPSCASCTRTAHACWPEPTPDISFLRLVIDRRAARIRRLGADAVRCAGGGDAGTIEAGKRADLLLLGADPLQDIEALRHPAMVIVRG
jgi:N-acyl-D-aspartate/D-glutamate deacylase